MLKELTALSCERVHSEILASVNKIRSKYFLHLLTKSGQITSDKLKPNETMETRSNIRTIKSRQSFPLKQKNVDLPDQEPQVEYYDNIN